MEFASHYVGTDGYRTHYLEAGSGRPLVLMHGGGAGADTYGNWRDCIPVFAKKYERHRAGHGGLRSQRQAIAADVYVRSAGS